MHFRVMKVISEVQIIQDGTGNFKPSEDHTHNTTYPGLLSLLMILEIHPYQVDLCPLCPLGDLPNLGHLGDKRYDIVLALHIGKHSKDALFRFLVNEIHIHMHSKGLYICAVRKVFRYVF